MRKILIISLRSDEGGGPKVVHELVRSLSKDSRFELYVGSPLDYPYGPSWKELATRHFVLHSRTFNFFDLYHLWIFCISNRDVIINSHGYGAGIYSRLLGLLAKNKIIHVPHGIFFNRSIKSNLKLYMERFLSFVPHFTVYVSDEEVNTAALHKIRNNPHRVIMNGVEKPLEGKIISSTNEFHYRVGILARFDPIKGIKEFLNTIIESQVCFKDYTFVIAGDGEQFNEIKTLIETHKLEPRIKLLGRISNIDDFFNEIDFFCSFSRSEGMPLSVIEAIVRKKPVILTNIPGHKIFSEVYTGTFLFDVSGNDFIDVLSSVVKRDDYICKIDFSVQKNIERYRELFLSM